MSSIPRLLALVAPLMLAGCAASAPAATPAPPIVDEQMVVPLLAIQPMLDGVAGAAEWGEAASFHGTFVIDDGSAAAGSYGFRAKIGVTVEGLHFLVEMPNFPPNPWNREDATYSDCVVFFFADDTGTISRPSFSLGACAGVSGYTTTHAGYWTGADWVLDDDPESGEFRDGRPSGGNWAFGALANGTLTIEFYTMRLPRETAQNGLALADGATARMSLLFMRVGGGESGTRSPDARGSFTGPHDVFPGESYTPNGHYDSTAWLRFAMPMTPST